MFYYNRYQAHMNSLKHARAQEVKAEDTIAQMIELSGNSLTYSDCTFIKKAVMEVTRCRRILQWSYCFGFYLADGCREKILFEDHQAQLEFRTDQLNEATEKDISELMEIKFRTYVISLTRAVANFREGCTNYCAEMNFVQHTDALEKAV